MSFHATKLFHTGEGGGIICRNKELADKIFYHHNFGHNGPEEFFGLGVNAKISELNAAMGLALMPYLDEIITKRKRICDVYDSYLENTNVQKVKLRENTQWNYSYYPIIFSSEDALMKTKAALNDAQVFPRRYFYPSLNRLPYLAYQKTEVAEEISKKILCIPLYAGLSERDTVKITEILHQNAE